jgi:spore coat protein U-like protein
MNQLSKTLRIAAVASFLAMGASTATVAATAQTTFTVTATVSANCTITATGISFTYDPIGANAAAAATASGSVTIACTKGAGPTIGLSAGVHAGQVAGVSRAMANGANFLGYELSQPAAPIGNSGVWTDIGGANAFNAGASPGKAPRTFSVSASVPGGQDVAVGSYSDTVTATVNF